MIEPLISGDEMVQILKVKGRDIGILLEALIEEQIVNPELNKDEALTFLKKKREGK